MQTIMEVLHSIKASEMTPILQRIYGSEGGSELLDVLMKIGGASWLTALLKSLLTFIPSLGALAPFIPLGVVVGSPLGTRVLVRRACFPCDVTRLVLLVVGSDSRLLGRLCTRV